MNIKVIKKANLRKSNRDKPKRNSVSFLKVHNLKFQIDILNKQIHSLKIENLKFQIVIIEKQIHNLKKTD